MLYKMNLKIQKYKKREEVGNYSILQYNLSLFTI